MQASWNLICCNQSRLVAIHQLAAVDQTGLWQDPTTIIPCQRSITPAAQELALFQQLKRQSHSIRKDPIEVSEADRSSISKSIKVY